MLHFCFMHICDVHVNEYGISPAKGNTKIVWYIDGGQSFASASELQGASLLQHTTLPSLMENKKRNTHTHTPPLPQPESPISTTAYG